MTDPAGPGSPTPLFLDQSEARRDETFFFADRAPPLPPPPTPLFSKGLDPAL